MNVRYRVELSQAERDELTEMLGSGKNAARKLKLQRPLPDATLRIVARGVKEDPPGSAV